MASRWDSLKSKFQSKQVDLDAEFEKFLNESMSDESVASSPRHKAPPLKSLRSKGSNDGGSSLPWWAEEDEEDERRATARQSWMKPKKLQDEPADTKKAESDPKAAKGAYLSTDTAAESTALSMSKDSLDDGSRQRPQESKATDDDREPEQQPSVSPDQFEDTLTYSDETVPTGTPVSSTPIQHPSGAPPHGLDTLQEMEDKKRFFEEEETSPDYGRKLQQISTSDVTTEERERVDKLQATGVEVGDSIFNISATGETTSTSHVTADRAGIDEEEHHYSDEFEETHDDESGGSRVEDNRTMVEDKPQEPAVPQAGLDPNKPSMLSKVSLMDSLDSTLDAKRPPPKRPPQQPGVETAGTAKDEPGSGTAGYLYSGNTETIAELQAALQQAQLEVTQASERNTGKITLPPTPTIIQGRSKEPTGMGQMVIDKTTDGETNSRGFDLQPMVITDNTPLERDLKPSPYKPGFGSIGMTLTSDSIDSASIPVDCRGFELQPAGGRDFKKRSQGYQEGLLENAREGRVAGGVAYPYPEVDESRGVEEEAHGDDDDDEDTPPPDSLRSIKEKVRARKSVEGSRRSSEKKQPVIKGNQLKRPKKTESKEPVVKRRETKKGTPSKGQRQGKVDRSSVDKWQPSLSSPPSWSPTPSIRKSKQKDKRPTKSRQKEPVTSPQHLAASVESFANYLKQIVRPEEQENRAPTPRWSDDEPIKSRASLRNVSESDQLNPISRERGLQEEVENWQLAWKDERRRNDKLISDMAARERDWSRAEERMREAYEQQMNDVKQEVFTLTARLREQEENADNRKRVAAGGKLKGVSEEDKKRLEREIHEQEELLKGYQQENERLYRDLKQLQANAKATEARMFTENQKLATEVANLKERLEQRSRTTASRIPVPGSAILGSDRITQLQSQLGSVKQRETKLQSELDELRLVNTRLESRLRAAERETDTAMQRAEQALGTTSQEREELKLRHEAELERLNRKLKWYAENQQLLDRDVAALRAKDQELKELRETVNRLRTQQGSAATERKQRTAERATDAKRTQDLQRQVREMEEIIKRRYPNSLPALIFAAASAPGLSQPTVAESPGKQSPSYAFLENRLKKLEKESEDKDEESNRRIRAIEQKYNAIKFDYEERIKDLEQELKLAQERVKLSVHPRKAHAQALEQDLAAAQAGDRRRISELESEISVLQDALAQASSLQAHTTAKTKSSKAADTERRDMMREKSIDDVKLLTLQKQLNERDEELQQLHQTCVKLRSERENMLSAQTQPTQVTQLELEITSLKQRLAEQRLNMDQDRVRYQGSLAESERMTRQAQDDAADQLEKVKSRHQQEVNQLRAEFAVRHSNSRVTELQSRVASHEIVIQKLRDKLAASAGSSEAVASAKAREEALEQEIARLHDDLRKAKENFTPEMHHFDSLQSKITAMELRFNQREEDLNRIINTTQIKSGIEKEESDSRWKQIVNRKNQEIERFREELDVILEALKELKRQGVILPQNYLSS